MVKLPSPTISVVDPAAVEFCTQMKVTVKMPEERVLVVLEWGREETDEDDSEGFEERVRDEVEDWVSDGVDSLRVDVEIELEAVSEVLEPLEEEPT
jgi:hypothetical protein